MYIKFFYQTLYQKLSESFHKNWLRFFLRKIKLYLRKIRLILSSLTVNLYGQVKFVPMLSNKVWTPGGSCRIHTGLLFPGSHSSLIRMSTLFIIYYCTTKTNYGGCTSQNPPKKRFYYYTYHTNLKSQRKNCAIWSRLWNSNVEHAF